MPNAACDCSTHGQQSSFYPLQQQPDPFGNQRRSSTHCWSMGRAVRARYKALWHHGTIMALLTLLTSTQISVTVDALSIPHRRPTEWSTTAASEACVASSPSPHDPTNSLANDMLPILVCVDTVSGDFVRLAVGGADFALLPGSGSVLGACTVQDVNVTGGSGDFNDAISVRRTWQCPRTNTSVMSDNGEQSHVTATTTTTTTTHLATSVDTLTPNRTAGSVRWVTTISSEVSVSGIEHALLQYEGVCCDEQCNVCIHVCMCVCVCVCACVSRHTLVR